MALAWKFISIVLLVQTIRGLPYWCVTGPSITMEAVFKELENICSNGEELSCVEIQAGGRCIFEENYYERASYVFNAIYQRNPSPYNCNFEGLSFLINNDPSTGSCFFQTTVTSMPNVTYVASPHPPPPPATITTTTITPLTSPPTTSTSFTFWISVAGIATLSASLSIVV